MVDKEQIVFAPCSEKQRLVLTDESTDVILTGGGNGGGKTRVCLTKYLGYLKDPSFRGVVFRQTRPFNWGLC